MIYRHFVYQVS